jgi:hypothetical protein
MMAINQIPDPCMCLRVRSLIKESAQNIMNNVNKELQTVVQKYTQNIVNNVNEDAFEK